MVGGGFSSGGGLCGWGVQLVNTKKVSQSVGVNYCLVTRAKASGAAATAGSPRFTEPRFKAEWTRWRLRSGILDMVARDSTMSRSLAQCSQALGDFTAVTENSDFLFNLLLALVSNIVQSITIMYYIFIFSQSLFLYRQDFRWEH